MDYIKPTFRKFKPDVADIVGFCVMIPFSISFTIIVLYMPTIAISYHYSYQIDQHNILYYYLVALMNVVFIAFAHSFSEKYLLEYNVEYKQKKEDGVSYVKRLSLAFSTFGSISSRLITSTLYLIILVISHLEDLNIISISDGFVAQLIQINKYSFIVLSALDKLLAEFKETKDHIKYKTKRWLELFYMYRLNIMQKETLNRIEELFSKKRYKTLFFEFGYVVDTIIDGINYYDFLLIAENVLEKNLFCQYYIALSNNSLIVSDEPESINDILEYVRTIVPDYLYEQIASDLNNKKTLYDAIKGINVLLQPHCYSIKQISDKINKKVIISLVEEQR